MTKIVGTIKDSGNVVLASGGITVKLDAPIFDVTSDPDSILTEIPRDFPIVNGELPLLADSSRGIILPQTETLNTTYEFTLYRNVVTESFYFFDGKFYDGTFHLHTDGKYYTGSYHTDDSVLIDRQTRTTQETISTFHAVVPNTATVEYAGLLPSRIATDKLPTTVQQIAAIIVNTPQFLAKLTDPKWRGNWDSTTVYNKYDEVQYAGSSWIYISSEVVSNKVPSGSSTYWQLRTSKGDPGSGTTGQDTAYNPSGWDGALWTPTANAIRDIIETLARSSDLNNYAPKTNATLTTPVLAANPANNDNTLAIVSAKWVRDNFATLVDAALTGNPSLTTDYTVDENSNKLAKTAWVQSVIQNIQRPYFLARKTDVQNVSISGLTVLTFSEIADTNNAFNPTTATFTNNLGVTAWFEFTANVYIERTGGTAISIIVELIQGTTAYRLAHYDSLTNAVFTIGGTVQLQVASSQSVQLRVNVYSGNPTSLSSKNDYANVSFTNFSGKRIFV